MNYELARELKDSGFPQNTHFFFDEYGLVGCKRDKYHGIPESVSLVVAAPTLSELIEACGEGFEYLNRVDNTEPPYEWVAGTRDEYAREVGSISMYKNGKSPDDAVAKLWLALNPKS